MTTLDKLYAEGWPRELIGLDQWRSLPEDDDGIRLECVEGMVQMAASPSLRHQLAIGRLMRQLEDQLSPGLLIVPDYDVLLVEDPLTVRRPDISVVTRGSLDQPQPLPSRFVELAVEVISPGSGSIDRLLKRHEYDDTGIPAYWIVDVVAETVTTHQRETPASAYATPAVYVATADLRVAGHEVRLEVAALFDV